MAEIEPHVRETVAAIPDYELRPLVAEMTQHLLAHYGPAVLGQVFPIIGKHWIEFKHHNWPPAA
jgi:hypothetical protein